MKTTIPRFQSDCPDGVYEQVFEVSLEEGTNNGTMCWGGLARRMQSITEDYLESSGLDWMRLQQNGKTWVILWSAMHILRLPQVGEKIILRTWASKKKIMMHTRKYAFYTDVGEPLLSVSSVFILMDLQTRNAVEDRDDIPDIPIVILENEPAPPKMREVFPKDFTYACERIVKKSEIDHNGHMNNTHYLEWVQSLEACRDKMPTMIWIQYSKELLEADIAQIHYSYTEDNIMGRILYEKEEVFSFKLEFVK